MEYERKLVHQVKLSLVSAPRTPLTNPPPFIISGGRDNLIKVWIPMLHYPPPRTISFFPPESIFYAQSPTHHIEMISLFLELPFQKFTSLRGGAISSFSTYRQKIIFLPFSCSPFFFQHLFFSCGTSEP